MKKLVVVFLLMVSCQVAIAQNHMTFRDIPIDGSLAEFVEKMKGLGYKLETMEPNVATMEGKFVNQTCEVYIFSTPKTNKVWKVVLFAPKQQTWTSLKSSYETYRNQYTQKYGVATNNYEFFVSPYYEGDGYETTAIKAEKAHFFSSWELEEGSIVVEISEYLQIRFAYEDEKNSDLAKREREERVLDEI